MYYINFVYHINNSCRISISIYSTDIYDTKTIKIIFSAEKQASTPPTTAPQQGWISDLFGLFEAHYFRMFPAMKKVSKPSPKILKKVCFVRKRQLRCRIVVEKKTETNDGTIDGIAKEEE